MQAALQTGARYGELAAIRISDFNADSGTVTIQQSKAGTARHIVLTDEGVAFCRGITAGRAGAGPVVDDTAGGGVRDCVEPAPDARAKSTGAVVRMRRDVENEDVK